MGSIFIEAETKFQNEPKTQIMKVLCFSILLIISAYGSDFDESYKRFLKEENDREVLEGMMMMMDPIKYGNVQKDPKWIRLYKQKIDDWQANFVKENAARIAKAKEMSK